MTFRVLKGISIPDRPKLLPGDPWPTNHGATDVQIADLIDCGALEPEDTVPEPVREPDVDDVTEGE